MTEAWELSQSDLEILVTRELRKAGLAISPLSVRRRTPLPPEAGRYVLLLEGSVVLADVSVPLLIQAHARRTAVDGAAVDAFANTMRDAEHSRGILVTTGPYAADALPRAQTLGIPLVAVVDGDTAWRSAGFGVASHRPPWFPQFCAQTVFTDAGGLRRTELLTAGRAAFVTDHLRPIPPRDDLPTRAPDAVDDAGTARDGGVTPDPGETPGATS